MRINNINILNLDEIKKAIEESGYFGVRGISKNELKYLIPGTELQNSWCHMDDIEEYELDGLSTMGVSDLMLDDEIKKSILEALQYSDCERVILVNGKSSLDGQDAGESLIQCAKFIMEVKYEVIL